MLPGEDRQGGGGGSSSSSIAAVAQGAVGGRAGAAGAGQFDPRAAVVSAAERSQSPIPPLALGLDVEIEAEPARVPSSPCDYTDLITWA